MVYVVSCPASSGSTRLYSQLGGIDEINDNHMDYPEGNKKRTVTCIKNN